LTASSTIPELDIVLTLRTLHQSGSLGSVLTSIGKTGGLIGDMSTLSVGKSHSVREVTVSVFDENHLGKVLEAVKETGTEVLKHEDLVFARHLGGKIHSSRKSDIKNVTEMRYVYTPGVARVCTTIQENPSKAKEYTNIANSVGIFTNGTRVLGLGDIGPVASMPVMEGKAVIYDQFVGISATPILIETKNPDEFINTVVNIAPTFGGIHLEDIRVPDCFYIEDELKKRLKKPVMHDDQHGTATVALAAVMSMCHMTECPADNRVPVAQIGLGAAGLGIAKILLDWGAKVIGVDPDPAAQKRLVEYGGEVSDLESAMQSAKVVILTTGKQGLVKPSMIQKDQIILALSNPTPEISPEEALAAGAAYAADGKSINNALAYPGLFKAALELGAPEITSQMKITAAKVISNLAEDDELVPSPFHPQIHQKIIQAIKKL